MSRPLAALLALLLAVGALGAGEARAHALEPGYLELRALGGDTWAAHWRKPAVAGRPMPIEAVLPAACDIRRAPAAEFDGRAFVARWVAACAGGIAGGEIAIEGLEATETDALVRYETAPGAAETRRLTPATPAFRIPARAGPLDVAAGYFALGLDHILQGADHLLFVFALLLLIRDRWRLLGAVTAFTVAHSISLAMATLGLIVAPAPPVEAVVALSIMFLAAELVRGGAGEARLSERYPWCVAFAFGLLHGLGFARALLDIGLPEGDIPLALFSFNLGVEAGQILFIGAVVGVGFCLARLYPATVRAASAPGARALKGSAYAIGGVAGFWLIARVANF